MLAGFDRNVSKAQDPLNQTLEKWKAGNRFVKCLCYIMTCFIQVGHIEGDASRSGTFPVNYVHKLPEGTWT